MIVEHLFKPNPTVVEGSAANDYFTRRNSEEERIAGTQAPVKNKKNPANTDYSKRRAQEKKVDQGVAEATDSNFVGFMNKTLGQKTDAPVAKSAMPNFMKDAPVAGLDSMGYRAALNFGMKTLNKLTPTQKTKLSIKGEDGVVNWLASQANKQGLLITDEEDDTPGKFMQEDLQEVQDFLPEVFKDPDIKSWAFVLTDGEPLPNAPVAGPFNVSINPGLPNDDGYANSEWKTLDTLENLPDAIQLAQGLARKNPKQFVGIWAANGKSAGFYWPGQGWRGIKEGVAEGSGDNDDIKRLKAGNSTSDGIDMQDIRLMAGEGKLTKKTVLQALAVIRKQKTNQSVTEGDNQSGSKTGIYQTEVYGSKAYHSKCLEKGCDWESRRFDRIKQAQDVAKKHAQKHLKSNVKEDAAGNLGTIPTTEFVKGIYSLAAEYGAEAPDPEQVKKMMVLAPNQEVDIQKTFQKIIATFQAQLPKITQMMSELDAIIKQEGSLNEFDAQGYQQRYTLYKDGYKIEKFGDMDDAIEYAEDDRRDGDDPSAVYKIVDVNKQVVWDSDPYEKPSRIQLRKPDQGVAEAFGPLPKDILHITLGRHTVKIKRVGQDNDHISFAWHDSKGQEHYEEVAVGDLGSYDDLIDRIKQEISYQERQYTDQGVAEAINPDITNPEFSHQQQIGDYLYVARYWSKGLKITAYDGNKKIGYAELMYQSAPFDDFADPKTTPKRIWLESEWTKVDPKYQRQGIMSTMYAYAKMLGNSVKPSELRSPDAKAAWASWRQAGDAKHLTSNEGVAEGSDDDIWGPQGNFAGDKHVDIGGVTMKIIQVGDTVKYLGQQAKVVEMSKNRKYSRISIGSGFGGIIKDVLTADLKQLGQGVKEGSKRKKKKTSRSLGRYFFPGYGYYGSGESSGGSGDGGGGESINRGVAEGFDKEAEAYKLHLLKTAPKVMDFLAKAVKGWRPSEEEMLGAIDTGYIVMKHTGDVKKAGKAMMDELNTLHRMSQGQQGVAEGSDKYGFHTSVSKGKFLPSKYGQDENNLYLHDLMNVSGDGSGPQLVTIDDKRIATELAAMYGGYVERTGMGTYRVYQPRGTRQTTKKPEQQGVAEGEEQQLSLQQLATISDEALDKAYGYGRSSPGNTFGWQANLKSAAYAKQMIDKGITDIEEISDAIHKGWNVTAKAFVQDPDQFDDTEKLKAAGKLEAKLQQRERLMNINYSQLPDDEQEKDRVVARALLRAINGRQDVEEVAPPGDKAERMVKHIKQSYAKDGKLTPREKGIAFATAWKAHKAGQVEEARMSAAQRLSMAWDKQRAKSDASLRRTPSSIPKSTPEPKKTDPVPKTVSESRARRRALMAQMLNNR